MNGALIINIVVLVTISAVFALVAVLIWRKLHENESLKYEFITIIAHKFRTPLTQIKWTTEGLLGDEQDSYKRQALTDIDKSNDNLIKLTGTLVELTDATHSAKSSYQFEKVNLCEMARQAMEVSKTLFHEKNLFMSVTCSAPEIYIMADKSRMEFVMTTLFENACSYTPPGRNISVTVAADKKRAALSVTDDGIGLDSYDMQHLFTKFYRSKQAQAMDTEGIGIGLYLARSVVKRHGGKIEGFSDGRNRGATFSVILPLAK